MWSFQSLAPGYDFIDESSGIDTFHVGYNQGSLTLGRLNGNISGVPQVRDDLVLEDGLLTLGTYGLGNNTGTPEKSLAVDLGGQIIETDYLSNVSQLTNDAGYITSETNVYDDDGTLAANRTISSAGNDLILSGGGSLLVNTTSGTGVFKATDGGASIETVANEGLQIDDAEPRLYLKDNNTSSESISSLVTFRNNVDTDVSEIGHDGSDDFSINSADDIRFETDNVLNMIIKADGKIGMGTSTPIYDWQVDQTSSYTMEIETDEQVNLSLDNIGTHTKAIRFRTNGSTKGGILMNAGTEDLNFQAGGTTTQLYIEGDDNEVGIGTSNPTSKLSVKQSSATLGIEIEESGAGTESWNMAVDADGDLNFYDISTLRHEFRDGGDVIIGGAITADKVIAPDTIEIPIVVFGATQAVDDQDISEGFYRATDVSDGYSCYASDMEGFDYTSGTIDVDIVERDGGTNTDIDTTPNTYDTATGETWDHTDFTLDDGKLYYIKMSGASSIVMEGFTVTIKCAK